MSYHNIPKELKDLNQWVVWKLVADADGKTTKIPFNPLTGRNASTKDPGTWCSYDAAVSNVDYYSGIGFVFSKDTPYFGIDIDKIDDEHAELPNWFETYAERSFSGEGIHIIGKGKLPGRGRKKSTGEHKGVEVYDAGRYFVMTGDVITKEPVKDCQEKLDAFFEAEFGEPEEEAPQRQYRPTPRPISESDHELLDLIRQSDSAAKFEPLWNGDISAFNDDHSRADASLMAILYWWTRGDRLRCESLFRQSGLNRQKFESRQDYRDLTWKKVDDGNVRDETPPEMDFSAIIASVKAPTVTITTPKATTTDRPWDTVTIEDVRDAISGTVLGTIADAICAPGKPELPLEVGLSRGLALCGCALSQKRVKPPGLAGAIALGPEWAKVRILSADGQVPNFYCLLIGRSSAGKDVGGIARKAAQRRKWLLAAAGSEEGLQDRLVATSNGVIAIGEMQNWLDKTHWQYKAASFLTSVFTEGCIDTALSTRGDAKARYSEFCYPSIMAAVQPGVIERMATTTAVESGFLGRFLICQMPVGTRSIARTGDMSAIHKQVFDALSVLTRKEGDVDPGEDYQLELEDQFAAAGSEPFASWRRLCGEYYPRMALILSSSPNDTSLMARITEDGKRRAKVLVYYFFRQAQQVFGKLYFSTEQTTFENFLHRIHLKVWRSPNRRCTKSDISTDIGKGTTAKWREMVIDELGQRKAVSIAKDGKEWTLTAIKEPQE
jgi:hypothetical protein